jgi:hypothetical protein
VNDCLIPYKDKHKGEKALLFGTGPSLLKYDGRFNDRVKFGSNEIVHYDTLMDYYMIGDQGSNKRGYKKNPEIYHDYQPNIAKFYRIYDVRNKRQKSMPEGLEGTYYNVTHQFKNKGDLRLNLTNSFGSGCSISFELLQFIVWTGVRDIILVGMDADYHSGTFHCGEKPGDGHYQIQMWGHAKNWAEDNGISIKIHNPKALKKYFEEV